MNKKSFISIVYYRNMLHIQTINITIAINLTSRDIGRANDFYNIWLTSYEFAWHIVERNSPTE